MKKLIIILCCLNWSCNLNEGDLVYLFEFAIDRYIGEDIEQGKKIALFRKSIKSSIMRDLPDCPEYISREKADKLSVISEDNTVRLRLNKYLKQDYIKEFLPDKHLKPGPYKDLGPYDAWIDHYLGNNPDVTCVVQISTPNYAVWDGIQYIGFNIMISKGSLNSYNMYLVFLKEDGNWQFKCEKLGVYS